MRMGVLSRDGTGRLVGGGGGRFAPRNGGLVSVEFQGFIERRERRFDPEHVLFCSVLCSLVSLFSPSSIFPHLRGWLYALDRAIGLDVGDNRDSGVSVPEVGDATPQKPPERIG